ncbi:ferric aerobactin receptor [Hymenobacter oligotrophus]|uniref:Ferric aerobactin receptor n=1 Tax=Hymenobacter oligotrophus TaxID=2319843 RepID=A0A3B7RAZ9_9BACT|nr:TonB-dependent receptor [Hymenobacter oligotrophus]AYA36706.1 ferric aerobactin receptor [Hymenobacter oligotrophus]
MSSRFFARLLFTLSGLLVSVSVFAQTLSTLRGNVRDAKGTGLPGATVRLLNTNLGAATDGSGTFEIGNVPAGDYTLAVTAVGYTATQQRVQVQEAQTQTLADVVLAENRAELGEVIVSASRRAEPIRETPVSATILNAREIQLQAAATPNNLAAVVGNAVPGLGLTTNQTGNVGQTLRGRNVLVLIDGIPQSTPLRAGGRDIRTIDPTVIERVEVIKGATAIFGNGADGGLINYITKRPVAGQKFGGLTTLGVNGNVAHPGNSLGYRATQQFYGKPGNFDYVVSGTFDQSGVYKDARGEVISPRYGLGETKTYNGFGKLGYDLNEKNRLELMYNYFSSRQNSDYVLRAGKYGQFPTIGVKGSRGGVDEGTRHNHNAYLTYRGQEVLPLRSSVEVTGYWQDFRTIYDAEPTFFEGGGQSEINSNKLGLRINLNTPILTGEQFNADVTYGLDLLGDETVQNLVDGRLWTPRMQMRNLAPYAQLRATLFEHFILKGGARVENIQVKVPDYTTLRTQSGNTYVGGVAVQGGTLKYKTAVYNAGLRYARYKWLNPFVSYSEGFSLYELGRTLRTARANTLSLLETEAIVVRNYEAGASSELGPLTLSGVYFVSKSDLGANLVDQGNGILVPQRAPERVWGYELTADFAPLKILSLGGSWSWVEGRATLTTRVNGQDVLQGVWLNGNRIAPPKATAYVRYQPIEPLSLALNYVYSGTRTRFNRNARTGAYASGEGAVNSFGLVNFTSTYSFTEKLRLTLGVENLLNNAYYTPIAQFNGTDANYTRGNGARFNLTAGYSF